MEQIHDRVAGLDVHRDEIAVCVRRPGPRGGVHTDKARFSTTSGGLAAMAGWLAECEVTLAAMEATGVIWGYQDQAQRSCRSRSRVRVCEGKAKSAATRGSGGMSAEVGYPCRGRSCR